GQVARGLRVVRFGFQSNFEVRFETLYGNALMIFKLEPLGSVSRNGNNASTKSGSMAGFVGGALTHLQQAWIYGLLLQLVINLFCALAFKDHSRNAHRPVPGGKI